MPQSPNVAKVYEEAKEVVEELVNGTVCFL